MRAALIGILSSAGLLTLAGCLPQAGSSVVYGAGFDAGQPWQGSTWVSVLGGHAGCSVERVASNGNGIGILETAQGTVIRVITPLAAQVTPGEVVSATLQLDGRRNQVTLTRWTRMANTVAAMNAPYELRTGYLTPQGVADLQRAGRASIFIPGVTPSPISVSLGGSSRAIDMVRQCQRYGGNVAQLRLPPAPRPTASARTTAPDAAADNPAAPMPGLDASQPTGAWAEPPKPSAGGGWMEPPASAPATGKPS